MFETHESGRKFSFFAKQGELNWDFVIIPLSIAWFYATCRIANREGITNTVTFCFSDIIQLKNIHHEKNIKLEFVDLVSPSYMNGSDRWKMEPLSEIWLQTSHEYPDQYEYVYVLQNGNFYTDKLAPQPEDSRPTKQKIFEI